MVLAREKRQKRIPPHTFRDTSFEFLGETILLWSLTEYFKVDKWREEAIRRSRRNEEAREIDLWLVKRKEVEKQGGGGGNGGGSGVGNLGGRKKTSRRRRRPFRQVMDALYEKSIANQKDNGTISETAS